MQKKNKVGQKANFICHQKFKTTFFSRTSSLYRTESSLKRTVPFQLREEQKRRLHPSYQECKHVSNEQGKPFTGPLCTKRLSNAYPRAMSATRTSKKEHKKRTYDPTSSTSQSMAVFSNWSLWVLRERLLSDHWLLLQLLQGWQVGHTSIQGSHWKGEMMMARHRIPDQLRNGNGARFSSHEFKKFTELYEFDNVTSSPS